jgi:serine phosphatase RsbU (regulator of sigma subunit)
MRILVGWDNPQEAETINLFLTIEDRQALVTGDLAEFQQAIAASNWDVVLLSLNFPSHDESFALFKQTGELQPGVPIIGACQQGQIMHLAGFITEGLHSYIIRDPDGEFIFLLNTVVESAFSAVLAQRSRLLADRLRQEIDSVRRLQESVIPKDLPSTPDYSIAARYEPSQIRVIGNQPVVMAGGDYYDVFQLNAETLIVLVGDAAGHGIKACMSIMTMHTLMRMIHDQRYQDTATFVAEVNRRVCKNPIVQDEGGFITLLYCTLNTRTHQLHWTSAGHPMPWLQDLATNRIAPLARDDQGGLPLGIEGDWEYQECTATIPPNSRLVLFSDGIVEAFPAESDASRQFGEAGVAECLAASAGLSLEQTLDKLFVDSHAFTQGSGRADDTSVVLVERCGK